MSLRSTLLAIATLAVVVSPLAAQGAPGGPGGPGAPGPMRARMARAGEHLAFMAHHLKLTEAQKSQMKEIHAKHQEALKAKRGAAHEARLGFRKAAQDLSASPDALRKLHQAAADRQFEAMLEQRAVRLESRAILSPEQRAEADRIQALAEERRQFRADRMRKAADGRGPGMRKRGMGPGGGPGMESFEDNLD